MARNGNGTTATKENGKAYSITALSRGIAVLNAFTIERPSLGLNEIVAATGLPKTTVFRILSTLVEHEFCALDQETGEYTLGFSVLRLGDIRRRQTNVHATIAPIMRELREALDETVVFSVRVGDDRVHVDALESKQLVRRTAVLGTRAPLHAGASSKVLLSEMSDDEIAEYIERVNSSAQPGSAIPDVDELWNEIARIRKLGFAESRGEVRPGGGALAAPVRDFSGRCVGAIDILTPNERYTSEHRKKVIAALLDGVARASARLGYRP